jgi:hypothetical protein
MKFITSRVIQTYLLLLKLCSGLLVTINVFPNLKSNTNLKNMLKYLVQMSQLRIGNIEM